MYNMERMHSISALVIISGVKPLVITISTRIKAAKAREAPFTKLMLKALNGVPAGTVGSENLTVIGSVQ